MTLKFLQRIRYQLYLKLFHIEKTLNTIIICLKSLKIKIDVFWRRYYWKCTFLDRQYLYNYLVSFWCDEFVSSFECWLLIRNRHIISLYLSLFLSLSHSLSLSLSKPRSLILPSYCVSSVVEESLTDYRNFPNIFSFLFLSLSHTLFLSLYLPFFLYFSPSYCISVDVFVLVLCVHILYILLTDFLV